MMKSWMKLLLAWWRCLASILATLNKNDYRWLKYTVVGLTFLLFYVTFWIVILLYFPVCPP
jgi:hypothetical protein